MIYRVKQLWWLIIAKPLTPIAQAQVEAVLSEAEMQLFQLFSYNEQGHGHRVLVHLIEAEQHAPTLLKAALLHDIGKIQLPLSWFDRCVNVVLGKLLPKRFEEWGVSAETPYRWKKSAVIKARHPAWGAEMTAAINSPEQTINLIRRHQDAITDSGNAEEDDLLRQLQWADDQS